MTAYQVDARNREPELIRWTSRLAHMRVRPEDRSNLSPAPSGRGYLFESTTPRVWGGQRPDFSPNSIQRLASAYVRSADVIVAERQRGTFLAERNLITHEQAHDGVDFWWLDHACGEPARTASGLVPAYRLGCQLPSLATVAESWRQEPWPQRRR